MSAPLGPLWRAAVVSLLFLAVHAGARTVDGVSALPGEPGRDVLKFSEGGHTDYGDWTAFVAASPQSWTPGAAFSLRATLLLGPDHIAAMQRAGIKVDALLLLLTAEMSFASTGWLRLPSDERMSTLLTPTSLAIEGGVQGAVTPRFGYPFGTPLDELVTVPLASLQSVQDGKRAQFEIQTRLPATLPPGLYRLRLDWGVKAGARRTNLNGGTFAVRPFSDQAGTRSYHYSPVFPASGPDSSGKEIDAESIQPRIPWVLLAAYNSNGYRGVVAEEDRHRFALSDRNIIPDEVILPLYDERGNKIAYSLEPRFPADSIDPLSNIPWDYSTGEMTLDITGPDGTSVRAGTRPFVAKSANGATTKHASFTAWKPAGYGKYVVTARGWIADTSGRRYEGGGTYSFWIAKRMTMATATFQGMPYPVGSRYGRDIGFAPAVPAKVEVTASLFVNSDPLNVKAVSYSGIATAGGLFGAAQGMKALSLDAPGEYHARILATYTDPEGHLWVCAMRHAGVVYSDDSPVEAHGKKILVKGKFVERGETGFEGYIEANGTKHLAHITFPYVPGDVLLIASEGQGSNKIEPVLTYSVKGTEEAWDPRLAGVGISNLSIKTSNGLSPHLFPEYITDVEYYYGAAPRPGFMSRFLVGESTVRAPYWPTSPNAFGGQIGASANGDLPGDIYRLLGGVVLRRTGKEPMYAGYIASAFLLPRGTNNNRVVAPGSEDLTGATGEKARFFLVGLRPGMTYEQGALFAPAVQVDPILPAGVRFVLTFPDGRTRTAEGTADKFGYFAGAEKWPLDTPGVYRYTLEASWGSHRGVMPGLPATGGVFYVLAKERPSGAPGLVLDLAGQSTFQPSAGVVISGTSTAKEVHFSLITPGAVIAIGSLPVENGRFRYSLDPAAIHASVPIYDIVNAATGKPEIGRLLHLTFFSEERPPGGTVFHDMARVIIRGNTVIATR